MRRKSISIFDPSKVFSDNFMDGFFSNTGLDFQFTNDVEMFEDENNVTVKFKAPGFKEEDIEISIEDNVLTISGKVEEKKEEKEEKKKYYYKEMRHESFSRSFRLPRRVNVDAAEAEVKDGLISVTMPKAEEAKPKKVSVKKKQ